VGELAAELGSLVPRLFERSRDQMAVVAKVIEQIPCLGALANVCRSASEPHTPDLHLVTGGGAEPIEVDEVAAPAGPTPVEPPSATARVAKKPATKAPAAKKPAAKKPAAKKPATKRAAAKAPASKPATAANAAAATPQALAIPDYDELAASQVIPRLDNMAPEELEAIRVHETSNRQRRTILSRVAQLQTG
jgi:hypothetical protein